MGLFYIFPLEEGESDQIAVIENQEEKQLQLRTYGPALFFWGVLAASLAVIGMMFLAIKTPAMKLIETQDFINQLLGLGVLLFLLLLPLSLLSFFLVEKVINKSQEQLIIRWKILTLPLWKKSIDLKDKEAFEISHHLDSPNMARLRAQKEMKAFENRGYYQLFALDKANKRHYLDRNSQKTHLERLKNLLSKY